ncbi:PE family protein, partial [Mycobacterium interjectum]
MSFVIAAPELMDALATDLANIGSAVGAANAAAAAQTTTLLAAGGDEVSTTVAAVFGAHAQAYQALSAEAAAFHQEFVQLLNGGAASYALSEAA